MLPRVVASSLARLRASVPVSFASAGSDVGALPLGVHRVPGLPPVRSARACAAMSAPGCEWRRSMAPLVDSAKKPQRTRRFSVVVEAIAAGPNLVNLHVAADEEERAIHGVRAIFHHGHDVVFTTLPTAQNLIILI